MYIIYIYIYNINTLPLKGPLIVLSTETIIATSMCTPYNKATTPTC